MPGRTWLRGPFRPASALRVPADAPALSFVRAAGAAFFDFDFFDIMPLSAVLTADARNQPGTACRLILAQRL